MKQKSTYSEKLKDPRWQKKRLEILERDKWCCQSCGDDKSTLHVHHKVYASGDPWDIEPSFLITLCENCHQYETDNIQVECENFIRAVKTAFLSSEIGVLCGTFYTIKKVHIDEVIVSALNYWLTDDERMSEMVEKYFAHLEEKRKNADGSVDELPF